VDIAGIILKPLKTYITSDVIMLMVKKNNALWLIVAVALGLFAYSLTAIFVNGFKWYLLYPLVLGIINLVAFFYLKK